MLSKTLENAINDQIKNELYSAYLYLSMSAYFEAHNLPGAARWMRLQSQEETSHAMRLFDYMNDRGNHVVLQAIDQPPSEFESMLDIFQKALEHERKVTGMINHIYDLAVKENDYPTQVEMQWFVTEQVEEEKSASDIVEQLKMIGEHGPSLIMLDRALGARGD
ncbi:MAG: ferritin [Anaerolineae bacterium]